MSTTCCDTQRLISVRSKCSDMFTVEYKSVDYTDYVPDDIGIGSGDYVEFSYCLNCGKIQGTWPLPDPEFFTESICDTCSGSGKCLACDSLDEIPTDDSDDSVEDCDSCNGTGYCHECGGDGHVG